MNNTAVQFVLGQAEKQVQLLHDTSKGFVFVCQMEEGPDGKEWKQYPMPYQDVVKMLQGLMGLDDVYISQSSFESNHRVSREVLQFRSFFTDLDYYNLPDLFCQTPEQIKCWLETDYFGDSLPQPNFILFSGRGLTVNWLIEPVTRERLPEWSLVQEYINHTLKELGADSRAKDPSRVFRLNGTINSKNGRMTAINFYSERKYTIEEMLDYIPDNFTIARPNKPRKASNKKSGVIHLLSERNLLYTRMCDLVILQHLRNQQGIVTGHREFMCFLYRFWNTCFCADPEQGLRETLAFNQDFILPLSYTEVTRATRSAEKAYREKVDVQSKETGVWGGYRYRNATLIDRLNIMPDEERKLKTIIGKEEKLRRKNETRKKKRRNEKGLTKRQQDKLNKQSTAIALSKQGLTQKEIANQMGICRRSVSNYLSNVQ